MDDHRADVLTPKGVIEFQKSSISTKEIREREQFYGRMVWVIDAVDFNLEKSTCLHWKKLKAAHPVLRDVSLFDSLLEAANERAKFRRANYGAIDQAWEAEPHYRWLWPRKSWLAAQKTLFLDRGFDYLLQVKWISRTGGLLICKRLSKDRFVELACR